MSRKPKSYVSNEVHQERQRAAAIVRAYRLKSEAWSPMHPSMLRIRKSMIEGFHAMENDIMTGVALPQPDLMPPGMSLDELERAAALINDLDANPFD